MAEIPQIVLPHGGYKKHIASLAFLLSLLTFSPAARAAGELPEGATVHVAPLTRAMWNQGRHYNLMCPTTASGGNDGRMWAGCTAVATAILLDYYQWPLQGTGDTKADEAYWPSDTISQRARFESPYDWKAIRDSYGHVVSARESLAIGTLMSDVGAILNMNYGASGSSTNFERIPGVLGSNFFFDNSYAPSVKEFNDENVARMKQQLADGHPIPCSGVASSQGTGHTYVCDGYATTSPAHGTVTNLFHFNFGWGGGSNGWYPLDSVFTSATPGQAAEYHPVDEVYLSVFPQRALQFARVPQVIPPDYTFRWGVPTCWTNRIEQQVLERQRLFPVKVDDALLPSHWTRHMMGDNQLGWEIGKGGVSGKVINVWGSLCWPGMNNALCSTKGVSISADTSITITYKAMKLPSGVTLKLTTCVYNVNTGEWAAEDPQTYQKLPTLAVLESGSSSESLSSKTVTLSGSDLIKVLGGSASDIHLAIDFDNPNWIDPTFAANTEIFRLESFAISGEAEDWVSVETNEVAITERERTVTGLSEGRHRMKITAKCSDGDFAGTQEINVSSTVRVPTVTAVETNANSVVFEVADATNFGYGFEYQSNALKGTPSASGSRITWTFNKTLAELGTHWLTLTVSNKVNGFVTKYVHITNPPEDHPLCPYTETTYAAAIERANREKKLICMLSSGSPESVKFEKLGGFLSTNEIVSAIGGKYIFVESNGLLDSDRDLVKGLWRQQPVPMGMTPNPFDPQRFAYTFVIDPRSPNQAVPCSPTAYGGLNSQYDFKYLSYPQLEVNSYKTFLAQDFGIHFPAGGTIFIVY